jgi:hypothetical protein
LGGALLSKKWIGAAGTWKRVAGLVLLLAVGRLAIRGNSCGNGGVDGQSFSNKEQRVGWEVVHPSGVEPETF